MKVDIGHSEVQKGFLKKTTYHVVRVSIQFSEEEKQIIKQHNLMDYTVLDRDISVDRDPHGEKEGHMPLLVDDLVSFSYDEYLLLTPGEAKNYEAALIDGLKNLKDLIENNTEIETKSTSFEL
jgi:hypothetical protein